MANNRVVAQTSTPDIKLNKIQGCDRSPLPIISFDSTRGLWQVRMIQHLKNDTITIPGLIPHRNTPFMIGCCDETLGWYDSIMGLQIVVPNNYKPTDSVTVTFKADWFPISSPPDWQAGGKTDPCSYRFSRSAEIRLTGTSIHYGFGSEGQPDKWYHYNKPLLINANRTLWIINQEPGKVPSEAMKVKFTRINDFEFIESHPAYEGTNSYDRIFRLVDGDTATSANDAIAWVKWDDQNIKIILSPGTSRKIQLLNIGFQNNQPTGFNPPQRIELSGSNDKETWVSIARKRIVKSGCEFRQKCCMPIDDDQPAFRYYRISLKNKKFRTAIDEIVTEFSPQ